MKAVVGWEAFRDALHLITQLVPGRANLGEPSVVQITTTGDAVVLSSQDYDCAVRIELTEDIDPKETGSITLPGLLLTSFVRDLRGKTLELRTKPNSDACSLSCGGDTLELVAAPEVNFDPLPEIDPKGTFEVPTETFAWRRTTGAASTACAWRSSPIASASSPPTRGASRSRRHHSITRRSTWHRRRCRRAR
jgi:DNA polymerase III sliding clamp (beta) subunit (PCNA family)